MSESQTSDRLDDTASPHKKKEKKSDRQKSNDSAKNSNNIEEELQATEASIVKMKLLLASQEKKFYEWEMNFRKDIPQLIGEAFEKRITKEVEKKIIEIESESEVYGGKKKKIKKIADIDDEDEKKAVQKAIDECIKEEKEKRANEEEIKTKYRHLIRTEVKKALAAKKSDLESSSSNEEALENTKPRSMNHPLKQRQYIPGVDRSRSSGRRGTPRYSPIEDYDNNATSFRYPAFDRARF